MKNKIQAFLLAVGILGVSAMAGGIAAAAPTGQTASAPKAFHSFCARNPSQCSVRGAAGAFSLDATRWSQLRAVNSAVNRSIRSVNDGGSSGRGDVWSVVKAGQSGDCEDFVLTKRSQLIAKGWPSSSLLVSVVRTRSGEGHAVLIARTSDGNYVLDNRTNAVRKASSSGYRFYTMQSPENPRRWIAVPRTGPSDAGARKRVAKIDERSGPAIRKTASLRRWSAVAYAPTKSSKVRILVSGVGR